MKLECQECGKVGRYAVPDSMEVQCKKCGGYDLDLASAQAPVSNNLRNMDPQDYEQLRSAYRRLRAKV